MENKLNTETQALRGLQMGHMHPKSIQDNPLEPGKTRYYIWICYLKRNKTVLIFKCTDG